MAGEAGEREAGCEHLGRLGLDWRVNAFQIHNTVCHLDDFICLAGARKFRLLTPCADSPDADFELFGYNLFTNSSDVFGKVHSTQRATISLGLQAL